LVDDYFDSSALVSLIANDPHSDAIFEFVAAFGSTIHISAFGVAEVSSAMSRMVRSGHIEATEADARLAYFDRWRAENTNLVEILETDFAECTAFVRRYDLALRAPDALHLAVARRNRLRLVTFDDRLARAAIRAGIAAVVPQIGRHAP